MYSSIWLPIVTPFRNGQVDVDALQRLADHYLRTEISGFVALGTTGEAALLDPHERMTVLHALFETVGTRLPIVIGVGGMNTSEMIRDMQQFDHWDSGGYLVSAPAYICPDQRGIQWHFEEIAHATDRPVVLYDVPHRTGVPILPDTGETAYRMQQYRGDQGLRGRALSRTRRPADQHVVRQRRTVCRLSRSRWHRGNSGECASIRR